MRKTRIYYPKSIDINTTIELDEQASRHVGLVLRLSIEQEVIVFNGDGFDYLGRISEMSKRHKNIKILIAKKILVHTESSLNIHLLQAISRVEKMDWVIQKAVELGVIQITPVMTEYCSVKLGENKLERFKKIIISACEQSGRAIVPIMHECMHFTDLFSNNKDKWNNQQNFVFDPTAVHSLNEFKKMNTQYNILIGPEGGFSEKELLLVQQYHFNIVKLGNRILRTETAPLCAISAIQTLWGDFY
jgi:16S rRNA (uracil1498-N3)-methyltransferase